MSDKEENLANTMATMAMENMPLSNEDIAVLEACLSGKISFEEAKATVLEALSVLGKDYTDLLKQGFDNRWIDVYENEGKRSGAYSSGNSRPHPYVLLNHKDNLDSMFTLAHEMGHALHSYHSTKNQPVNTSDYVILLPKWLPPATKSF